jgi:hypothetical protein
VINVPGGPLVDVEVNDYVVVRFQPEGKHRTAVFYVGFAIKRVANDIWRIRFLRRKGTSITQFRYPKEEDIDDYPEEMIV